MATGRRTKTTKGASTGRARGQSSTVFERAAATLHVMGVVENLRLLIALLAGPRAVAELAMATGKSRYLVARRLAKLSRAGLVVLRSRTHCELRGERSRRLVRFAQERLREPKRRGRLPRRSSAADLERLGR